MDRPRLALLVLVSLPALVVTSFVGIGIVAWAFDLTAVAPCEDNLSFTEEFVARFEPVDLGGRRIPEPSVAEWDYFECEDVHLRFPADSEGLTWLSFRRTAPGAADDPDALQIWRDNDEFVGEHPMIRGERFIFADDCVAILGRHARVQVEDVITELGSLFQLYRDSIDCPEA